MTTEGEAARESIDALYGNSSYDKQVIIDDLNELQQYIDAKTNELQDNH